VLKKIEKRDTPLFLLPLGTFPKLPQLVTLFSNSLPFPRNNWEMGRLSNLNGNLLNLEFYFSEITHSGNFWKVERKGRKNTTTFSGKGEFFRSRQKTEKGIDRNLSFLIHFS
jgi:hypothetical protein